MTTNEAAKIVKETVLGCSAVLDESAKKMLLEAEDHQAARYRRLVGAVLGEFLTEVLIPIYRAFPDLEPPEIREARLSSSAAESNKPRAQRWFAQCH